MSRVRHRLDRDRAWSAYALGDLSPPFAAQCEWRAADDNDAHVVNDALVLVYRGFDIPIVFGIGPTHDLHPVLQEVRAPVISLQLRPDAVSGLAPRFEVVALHPMTRMVLHPELFAAPELAGPGGVDPLGPGDVDSVRRLYADGDGRREAPDFFHASMLEAGMFCGVREGDALVAVAGTHLVAVDVGVCAIGNVYTRADRRGRGLGTRVTAAVVAAALRRDISTIVLNVREANHGARRVYERLGFRVACDFVEGVAREVRSA